MSFDKRTPNTGTRPVIRPELPVLVSPHTQDFVSDSDIIFVALHAGTRFADVADKIYHTEAKLRPSYLATGAASQKSHKEAEGFKSLPRFHLASRQKVLYP